MVYDVFSDNQVYLFWLVLFIEMSTTHDEEILWSKFLRTILYKLRLTGN